MIKNYYVNKSITDRTDLQSAEMPALRIYTKDDDKKEYSTIIRISDQQPFEMVLPDKTAPPPGDTRVYVPYKSLRVAGVDKPILGEYGVGYIMTYTDPAGKTSNIRKLITNPAYKLKNSPEFELTNKIIAFFHKDPEVELI